MMSFRSFRRFVVEVEIELGPQGERDRRSGAVTLFVQRGGFSHPRGDRWHSCGRGGTIRGCPR